MCVKGKGGPRLLQVCACAVGGLNLVCLPHFPPVAGAQDAPKARQQFVTSGALARLQATLPGLDLKGRLHTSDPPSPAAYRMPPRPASSL